MQEQERTKLVCSNGSDRGRGSDVDVDGTITRTTPKVVNELTGGVQSRVEQTGGRTTAAAAAAAETAAA